MLATVLVTSAGDLDNNQNIVFGSLRWAIGQTNATDGGDTIIFAESLFTGGPATISLDPRAAGGQLTITSPLAIIGPGPGQLTISQTKANRRIFETNIGAVDEIFGVEISGVTLQGGNLVGFGDTSRGGAIYNREALRMVETIVTGNSVGNGGGAIFTQRGSLTLDRSLIYGNSAGIGGGIMNGTMNDDDVPSTRITNSTITGNSAFGIPGNDDYGAWGGGVFNRNGRVTIINSTITGNSAGAGAGVASFGNPLQDDPPPMPAAVPPPTVFTYVGNSIIWGNGMSDVERVGQSDDDPPRELYPSFFPANPVISPMAFTPAGSLGSNIVGTGNATMAGDDLAFTPGEIQPAAVIFITDMNGDPILGDAGGSTPVFLLDPAGPAVDTGDPTLNAGQFEQRGRHFVRAFDYTGVGMDIPDIGAVELQQGVFVVDTLKDESDNQFSQIYENLGTPSNPVYVSINPYTSEGDFSLREAIRFSLLNPEPDIIQFSLNLRDAEPPSLTPNPPTIVLTLGVLPIQFPLVIEGPTTFTLEIQAFDSTPTQNEGNGSRVFYIDDGDPTSQSPVDISSLTIMGADVFGVGGGIYNREDLTLTNVTLKDNNATDDGGALYVHAGTVQIDDSTFSKNRAGDDGGAIYVEKLAGGVAPDVTIVNSTFSANTAGDRGGAINNNNGLVHVSYSTITLNTASSNRGNGVWNSGLAGTSTDFLSTIISANSVLQDNVIDNDVEYNEVVAGAAATIVSNGYNFVGGGNASPNPAGSGRFTNAKNDITRKANPLLGPLLNTGGQTETHRPLAGSLVIDAGDPIATPGNGGVPDFDQRGPDFTRVFDGDMSGVKRIDIGAYELQSSTFTVSTAADENDGDYSMGDLSLREAIQLANDNPLADTIEFDPMITGLDVVWTVGGGQAPGAQPDMKITADLTITGPGSSNLALNGANLIDTSPQPDEGRRLFTIDDNNAGHNINVTITGLTLTGMRAVQAGGAIFSRENLTLDDMTLINNGTVGDGFAGGAIYTEKPTGAPPAQDVQLKITNSIFTGNTTNGVNSDGGAIFAKDVGVVIDSFTTISGNSTLKTLSDGGGLFIKSNSTSSSANFNLDTTVDGFDFLAWQRNFGRVGANKSEGDANGDAVVNGLDFGQWKAQNGTVGNQGGTLSLRNGSSVTGNATTAGDADGGGIFSDAGEMLLEDAVVSGNRTTGNNSEGGGLVVKNSNVYLTRAIVSLNQTFGNQAPGGGVYVVKTAGPSSTLSLVDSIVELNTTAGLLSNGGGVAIQDGTVVMRNTTVNDNQVTGATSNGGGLSNVGGNLVVRDSTVANNTASSLAVGATPKGGGVYSDTNLLGTQSTLILNSTVSGNTGQFRGGGVFNADGLTEIQHSTITNNTTSFANLGAGVASMGNAATQTRVRSSIIAGNHVTALGASTDVDFVDGGTNSFVSQGYNLLGTGNALGAFSPATNFINITSAAQIGLDPLADNGGQNALPGGLNPLTHALQPGSLAKNAGDPLFNANNYAPPLIYDERGTGFNRVQLGHIDIGAFESPVFPIAANLESASTPAVSAALVLQIEGPRTPDQAADATAATTALAPQSPLRSLTSLGGLEWALSRSHARRDDASSRVSDQSHAGREPRAAVLRQRLTAFDSWSQSPQLDDASLADTAHARIRQAETGECDAAAGDAVFELLGDDLLS